MGTADRRGHPAVPRDGSEAGPTPPKSAASSSASSSTPLGASSTYSKGNRQKVALVAALSSGVELFLFDEPTDGLDPLMVEVFREELGVLRARGATVLLSSHQLSEVEEVCDRVTILRDGRTVEAGTLDSLRQLARVQVRASTTGPPHGHRTGLRGAHRRRGDGDDAALRGRRPTSSTRCSGSCTPRASCRSSAGPPSLESIFLSHYAATREAPGA